jgi:hypothetical protein
MVKPCTEEDVLRAAQSSKEEKDADVAFVCQATRLPLASEHLNPWDIRQYLEDYTSGNVSSSQWVKGVIYISFQNIISLGIGLGLLYVGCMTDSSDYGAVFLIPGGAARFRWAKRRPWGISICERETSSELKATKKS